MKRKPAASRINLISLWVRVIESSNRCLEGISGKVVDETKNLLILKTGMGEVKKIPKYSCLFEIEEGNIIVDGTDLVGSLDKRLVGK